MKKYRDDCVELPVPRPTTMTARAYLEAQSRSSPTVGHHPSCSLRVRIRRKVTFRVILGVDENREEITQTHSAQDSASFLVPSAADLLRSPTAADLFFRSRILSVFPSGGGVMVHHRILAGLSRILARASRNATRRHPGRAAVVTGTVSMFLTRDKGWVEEEKEEEMKKDDTNGINKNH